MTAFPMVIYTYQFPYYLSDIFFLNKISSIMDSCAFNECHVPIEFLLVSWLENLYPSTNVFSTTLTYDTSH